MSSASSSKKHCAKEHGDAPKNKQNRIEIAESTEDKMKEKLDIEVTTTSEAVMVLSTPSHLNKEVNLTIDYGERKPSRHKFHNLKSIKLKYFNGKWKNFFKNHNFPDIEELRIEFSLKTEECERDYDAFKWVIKNNFNAIFSGMKNLKKLYIRTENPRDYDYIDYTNGVDAPFNLESADVDFFYEFINNSMDTLKQLKLCERCNIQELTSLYENYPKLEEFSAELLLSEDDLATALPKNESVKLLDIHIGESKYEKRTATDSEFLKHILASTPSLETLTMYTPISKDFVKFLAHTMPKLKKVIGRGGVETDALTVFNTLKSKKLLDFEICLEEIRSWDWEEKLREKEVNKIHPRSFLSRLAEPR